MAAFRLEVCPNLNPKTAHLRKKTIAESLNPNPYFQASQTRRTTTLITWNSLYFPVHRPCHHDFRQIHVDPLAHEQRSKSLLWKFIYTLPPHQLRPSGSTLWLIRTFMYRGLPGFRIIPVRRNRNRSKSLKHGGLGPSLPLC